ncbi:MAG: polysaccharide deacetylase family protein [Hydrogeniiclostridium sp.]
MKTLLFFTLDARQTAARIVYVFLTATLFILICFSLRTAAPIPLTGKSAVNGEKAEKTAALTFDCSLSDEYTDKILGVLSQHTVKATFFVTGDWAENHPESLTAIYEAGHEIGTHSASHKHFSSLTLEEKAQELLQSRKSISSIISVPILWFRPPYGDSDRETYSAARASGLSCVLWDLDSQDWKNTPPKQISSQLASQCRDGDILLFQNEALNTSTALSYLIPALEEKGFRFATISELYAKH